MGSSLCLRALVRKAVAVSAAVAIGSAAGAVAVLAPLAWSTLAWADEHDANGRLLPGTVVAGVDVGGLRAATAERLVTEAVEVSLDEPVALTHDGRRWSATPRELGTRADAAGAVQQALAAAADARLPTLARARWGDTHAAVDVASAVAVVADPDVAAAFVDDLADTLDRPPRDATITWGGDGAELVEHRTGLTVDRAAATAAVVELVESGGERPLPATIRPVSTTTDEVAPLLPAVAAAAEAAVERPMTLVAGGDTWSLTPAEIGAAPDTDALLARLRSQRERAAHGRPATGSTAGAPQRVPLTAPDAALAGYVDRLGDERVDREVRDAHLDYADGWVDIVPAHAGRALDRDTARRRIRAALAGGADTVELPVAVTAPSRTADAYAHVLLVRRGERRLYHYVDGEIARSWPVAVGGGGSPTPTGMFAVGAKRHSPSWYNPDPDGWGADMPPFIGPGPDNPLGVRALNWTRRGRDTLIRFHGTANVRSIGRAASRGCVRLTNAGVRKLFDRVPSGATIVSI